MSSVQCPICDFTVGAEDPDAESPLSLLGVSVVGFEIENEFNVHLESHTVTDWVRAFAMADRYIAKLEKTIDEQNEMLTRPLPALAPVSQPAPAPRAATAAPQVAAPTFSDPEQALMERMFRPDEIARMKARQAIQAADPDQSLIPFIPTAQRAEGVVGRKS